MNKEELEREMAQCYGTECYYRHQLINMMYTDGVKCFALNAGGGAYWFLTDCGLFVRNAIKNRPDEEMFAVHLVVSDSGKADLIFKDCNDEVVYKKHYAYTDCPEGDWLFYYFVSEKLLIWKGEY